MERSKAKRRSLDRDETKLWLDEVLSEFSRKSFLYSDPLSLVHSYERDEDREFVALVAALFSFGNVSSILASVEKILQPLGSHPQNSLLEIPSSEFERIWKKSYYRFYSGADIAFLFERLQSLILRFGSLQAAFLASGQTETLDLLFHFRTLFTEGAPATAGIKFMFADPFEGTAKRWHMFLRWVVRKDEVDLGLWHRVSKSKLIQPLDTHLFQIGRALRLTDLRTPGLQAALEMTDRFRQWDPEDPIKYDFALCRLGVLRQKDQRLRSLIGDKRLTALKAK